MISKKMISRAISIALHVAMTIVVIFGSAAHTDKVFALGSTITVASISDESTTNSSCSLREAIINANSDAFPPTSSDCTGGSGNDTIVFSSALGSAPTITLTIGALPNITDTDGLTINGGDRVTVSGNDVYRVFVIAGSAPLTLDSLTISHGKVTSGTGGGIFNAAGFLTLTNCLLSNNSASDGNGGAVASTGGTLTINDSIFSNNTATKSSSGGYGGGIYAFNTANPTSITRTIFSGNTASIRGGAIDNYYSSMTITDSTLSGNSMSSAGDGGGAIYNDGGALTITHSTFATNTANSAGGKGGGILSLSGSNSLTITTSTFYDNSVTTGEGGAIATNGATTISNSTFKSNYADFGGGFYNGIGGTLTSLNNTFSANSSFNSQVIGGGIYNESTLNLYNTIVANSVNGEDCYNSSGNAINSNVANLIETNGISGHMCGTPALTADPDLGAVTLINPIYFPLNSSSPAIDAGDDATCAGAPVNNASQNGLTRPQGTHCDIGAYESAVTRTFRSVGVDDGWILESTETSGVGGTMNNAATTFNIGDGTTNRQYRAILHFDTSLLPDNAQIVSATLMIKKQSQMGTDPFTILGSLRASERKPSFGLEALELADFKSAAGKSNIATFGNTSLNNWYSAILTNAGNLYISRTGSTQFRLSFSIDDNNDNGNDFMKFFSGNAPLANRPQLVIQYYTQ